MSTLEKKFNANNIFNKYFDKVYIVSLKDKQSSYQEVSDQLSEYKINHERFLAIDGRGTKQEKREKRRMFQKLYNVKIPLWFANEGMPAVSLSIGNVLMIRNMIKNNWKRILIFEDDIILSKNFMKKFKEGIEEILEKNIKYDVLYLSCAGECGTKGVSYEKSKTNNYLSTWMNTSEHMREENDIDKPIYVHHKFDIRIPCDKKKCKPLSEHISVTKGNGGTFAYAITNEGGKKLLEYIDNVIDNHIDQFLIKSISSGILKGIAFDPVIIYHKDGMLIAGQNTIQWV
jgi:GR25 family glycosyltransferase involved in LPS biosynthesis